MTTRKNSIVRMEQAIGRMIVTHGMSFEQVMERYPDVSIDYIEHVINKFRPGERGEAAKSIGVCLGSKQEPYWENEMDTWTGSAHRDNPFKHLKYKDVEKEKINIQELKIDI